MHKVPLVVGETYHVFSKSIAGFRVFEAVPDCDRMLCCLRYFRSVHPFQSLSWILRNEPNKNASLRGDIVDAGSDRVQLIAYCLMPTHFHLLLRQKTDAGISIFISQLLNSYTRYFNIRHNRKGPLWESTFKSVHIETDEQALHLTRYIHLNPVTAHLVKKPEDRPYSSYSEYLGDPPKEGPLTNRVGFPTLTPDRYARFVNNHSDHQRMLGLHKHLLID